MPAAWAVALAVAVLLGPWGTEALGQAPALPPLPTPAEVQRQAAQQAAAAQCAAAGCAAWNVTYREAGCCGRTPLGLSPDGSVAYAAAGGALLAFDTATGAVRWTNRDSVAPWHQTTAIALAVAPDGSRVHVAREGRDTWGGSRYVFVSSHDPARSGVVAWRSAYLAGIEAWDLVAHPDGRLVYLAGGDGDAFLLALDASTGAPRWKTRYNGQGNALDVAVDAAMSPDGGSVFVAGATTGMGGRTADLDYLTMSIDAGSGAIRWAASHEGHADGEDRAWAVAAGPDGVVYVTGQSAYPETRLDLVTIAYRTDSGSLLWSSGLAGQGTRNDVGLGVVASPDGTMVYVAGESGTPGTGTDATTLALEAVTGRMLWVAFHDSLQRRTDVARSVALSPSGGVVYVAGELELTASNRDFALLAYEAASGAPLWLARHAPSNILDGATSLAVAPGGARVLVAGHAESAQGMNVVAFQAGAAIVAVEAAGSV